MYCGVRVQAPGNGGSCAEREERGERDSYSVYRVLRISAIFNPFMRPEKLDVKRPGSLLFVAPPFVV